ncbi:MAG TPA: methyltransferase domain-containing protein [Solirubrobacteraceae bacterium]|nr:methyltransferase domain-containing protein [Solirubrobacteraceae bacterium]
MRTRTGAGAVLYEHIGGRYARVRRPDARIADALMGALGDAATVLNVGAGTGSYEPSDRDVLAVEPSATMRSGRPAGSAPCLAAEAEALPLADGCMEVAMAVYSDMHWRDRSQGIAEMVRVSTRRVVVLTVDREASGRYWLTRDYFRGADDVFAPLSRVTSLLPGPCRVTSVPIPHDCSDGFVHAFWRRPQALLGPQVRATMSVFARLDPLVVERGVARLRADLNSGAWHRRNHEILDLEALDLGHRLVVWERDGG